MIEIVNDVASYELFKENKVHVVCPANGGLTFCDTYAMSKGMKQDDVWKLTKHVNDKNEVGTFYPNLSLTVIPLEVWNSRKESNLEDFYNKHLRDVFDAHNNYIKCEYIHFILNDSPRNIKDSIAYKELEKILKTDNLIADRIEVFEMK